jgi:hypothetical protein
MTTTVSCCRRCIYGLFCCFEARSLGPDGSHLKLPFLVLFAADQAQCFASLGAIRTTHAHGITLEFDYSGGKRAISCAGAGIAAAFQRAVVGRTKIWPG